MVRFHGIFLSIMFSMMAHVLLSQDRESAFEHLGKTDKYTVNIIKDHAKSAISSLNESSSLNQCEEEHYYLLFQLASLTGRDEVAEKVKEACFAEFPFGELL